MTDRFDLLQQIGKGGMGTVWRARDRFSGRTVAIKLLHPGLANDPYHLARLEREVEVARRIDSPNVVRTLGWGQQDGLPFIAMEFVDGQSLRDLIASGKTKDFSEWSHARSVLRQLATALAAAHRVGVIHRDIKPANVMIDHLGNVRLADFGIARAVDMSRMTGGETILGTPAYMAPDAETTAQSDLYALGCVIYEMVTGDPPFVGETAQKVLLQHLRDTPDLSRLPEDLRELVGWLLQKEPRKRPASAEALLEVLAPQAPANVPTSTGAATANSAAAADLRSRRRWPRVAAGVTVIAAVFGGAGTLWQLSSSAEPAPKRYVATGGVPTTRPTLVPAPDPGPPVIEELRVEPEVARPGEPVKVIIRFLDPDGDAVQVVTRRIGGIYWEFGQQAEYPVQVPKQEQWLGTALGEYWFQCSRDNTSAELEFTVVDAAGGTSQPVTARFECHE